MFPHSDSEVYYTPGGTPYLKSPGIALLARTTTDLFGMESFLSGFPEDLDFPDYLEDGPISRTVTGKENAQGSQLCKTAGQLCYLSFSGKRTKNAGAREYFKNILSSGHGSVLEHAQFSFLIYGVSRSLTHELVRHRVGVAMCLAGDTEIYSDIITNGTRQTCKKRTIKSLYERTLHHHGRSRLKLIHLRTLDESNNEFTKGRIHQVISTGIQDTYKVTLSDGKAVTCTTNHRFLTTEGWLTLNEIEKGNSTLPSGLVVQGKDRLSVFVNGQAAYKDAEWLKSKYHDEGLSQETIGKLCGVSEHTIRSWVRKHNLQKEMGSWCRGKTPPNFGKQYKNGPIHSPEKKQKISERMLGDKNHRWKDGKSIIKANIARRGVSYVWERALERDNYTCKLCGSTSRLSIHHIYPVWAFPEKILDLENIVTVCVDCHNKKLNGKEKDYVAFFGGDPDLVPERKQVPGRGNVLVPKPVKIVSILYVGKQETYDIEMQDPYHNFVANGIIVHNSQVSQRYVSGKLLRFVERPEFQEDALLHGLFEQRIDRAAREYEELAQILLAQQKAGDTLLSAEARTDARKKVNQSARALLPNETEAPLIWSGNARSYRHLLEMRGSSHAELEIRKLSTLLLTILKEIEPVLFQGLELETLSDGTQGIQVKE